MDTITVFEEQSFNMETIIIKDVFIKKEHLKKRKNLEDNYIEEAIKEAYKTLKHADSKKNLFKNNSRFFYNKKYVDILMEKLKQENLQHEIGFRNLGSDEDPCYEVNFIKVLNNTKPEKYLK